MGDIREIRACGHFPSVTVDAGGPYLGHVGDTIRFQATLSVPTSYEVADIQWRIRQGSGSSVEVSGAEQLAFDHVFTKATTERSNIRVELEGSHGEQITASDHAEVSIEGSTIAAGGPYSGKLGETIQLRGSASIVPARPMVSVRWIYENEPVGDALEAEVTFGEPTTTSPHRIRLEVTDSAGDVLRDSAMVELCRPAGWPSGSRGWGCCPDAPNSEYDPEVGTYVCAP